MKTILWCMVFFDFTRAVVCRPIKTTPSDYEIEWLNYMNSTYEYEDFFEGDMNLNDHQLAEIFEERSVSKEHKY